MYVHIFNMSRSISVHWLISYRTLTYAIWVEVATVTDIVSAPITTYVLRQSLNHIIPSIYFFLTPHDFIFNTVKNLIVYLPQLAYTFRHNLSLTWDTFARYKQEVNHIIEHNNYLRTNQYINIWTELQAHN